jgi:hypothetical protein
LRKFVEQWGKRWDNPPERYEATMQSLESVVGSTGRDMTEVLAEMEKHTGGLASKASIAQGFLKGMTTELTVDQMGKMTQAIKDASIAMGEDFNTQLPLIIKAIKQLNPAILDNIGVTVRLDRVNKRIRDGYYGLNTAVNEATQQQAIFTEIMQQTAKFRGLEAEFLETTQGKLQKLTTDHQNRRHRMIRRIDLAALIVAVAAFAVIGGGETGDE